MLEQKTTIGRNQPCPCGSGKKYKKCCGQLGSQETSTTLDKDLEQQLSQAQALFDNGEFDKAVGVLKDILGSSPNSARVVHLFGLAQVRSGWVNEGIESLGRSVELESSNAAYWNDYGLIMQETGDAKKAVSCYEKAHVLNKKDTEPIYNLGRILVSLKAWSQAIKYLETLEQLVPDDLEVIELSALAYAQANKWEGLKRCAGKGLNLDPENKLFQFYRAKVWDKTSQFDLAYKEYARIYEEETDSTDTVFTDTVLVSILRLLESNHKLDEAKIWVDRVPEDATLALKAMVGHIRAKIQTRKGNYDSALKELEKIDGIGIPLEIHSTTYYLRGQALDKLGNYPDAFIAFQKANELVEKCRTKPYKEDKIIEYVRRNEQVFTRGNAKTILNSPVILDEIKPAPIFVLGFLRSGTTLVEQILSSHPSITAGDELLSMVNLENQIPRIIGSGKFYPECLLELNGSGNKNVVREFRECYMRGVHDTGVPTNGYRYFTDKELSNTYRMGLIRLVFPESPIIHVLRHPLDSCLSTYFARFGEHIDYATNLKNTAMHYSQHWKMIKHYKQELELKYHAIRYEDLITDPETKVRELLEFIDEPWDERCLEFYKNKRVARTLSYEQVTKRLYKGSMHRYKNYRKQVEEIVPILEPIIEELGYSVD